MSRTSALWTAAAVALLFALMAGAVILRPVLSANAGGTSSQSGISTGAQEQPLSFTENLEWSGDDEEAWEDEDDRDDEGGEYDHDSEDYEDEHDDDD